MTPTRDDLRRCEGFILDLDGTLYVDEQLVPGALDLIAHLEQRDLPYVFLTNNSSRRALEYVQRLRRLGVNAEDKHVITSGTATIDHLLARTAHRSLYLVGTPALEDEFRDAGFNLDADDPDCVVVAFDTTLTYAKLERAAELLFAGKPYWATHPDRTCITQRGLIPDIAAIIAGLEAVTRRLPEIVGKPASIIVEAALRRLGTAASKTAMVGDQLDTDLTMAQNCDLVGVLVMSGETTMEKLQAWPSENQRFLRASNVAEMLGWLR